MDYKKVGKKITFLRIDKELSQCSVAKILDITPEFMSYIINGKRKPSLDLLCKIADFFDVSLDYLTGRTEIK